VIGDTMSIWPASKSFTASEVPQAMHHVYLAMVLNSPPQVQSAGRAEGRPAGCIRNRSGTVCRHLALTVSTSGMSASHRRQLVSTLKGRRLYSSGATDHSSFGITHQRSRPA
jgi:hypothetical protein